MANEKAKLSRLLANHRWTQSYAFGFFTRLGMPDHVRGIKKLNRNLDNIILSRGKCPFATHARNPLYSATPMAELLGVVSGGIAVASLAIQLVEVAQKVHSFWDSIGDSTPKIERIKDLLLLMQVISTSIIEICNEEPRVKCGDAVFRSLDVCKTRADKLEKMIANHGLSSRLTQSKRRWSTVKLKLKERTIDKIETQLGTDVTMLLLTLQPFFQ